MDRNGDGKLNLMELYAAVLLVIAKVNDTPLSIDPPPLDLVKEVFVQADLNKDGLLNFDEFDGVLIRILVKNLCVRLALKTFAKVILAPLIALSILWLLERYAPKSWLGCLSTVHRGFGLIFATIMLCGVILPQVSPLIDSLSQRELMQSFGS